MLPDSHIYFVCRSCLDGEAVGERLRVVRAVSESRRLVAKCDACGLEKAGMCIAEGVPTHPRMVKIPHPLPERLVGGGIVMPNGEIKRPEDLQGARTEGNEPRPGFGLGRIDPAVPVSCALHPEDFPVDVTALDGDSLTPPESGENDQFGHNAPGCALHPLEDLSDLTERERRIALRAVRYARTIDRLGDGGDDPAPGCVSKRACKGCVDCANSSGGLAGGHQIVSELSHVLRPDPPDGGAAEVGGDVLAAAPEGGEGTGAGSWCPGFRVKPCGYCISHGLLACGRSLAKCPFSVRLPVSDRRVGVAPGDLAPDDPLAAALVPFLAAVTALLRERSHGGVVVMNHNDNGLPKEPEASQAVGALSKHDQSTADQHGAHVAPSRVERALETPAPGRELRQAGVLAAPQPPAAVWGVSNRRTKWHTVDEWFGVESWMHYRHDIANPHRHAAVRYRHFMEASDRVLGEDWLRSPFHDESDAYIDAAHACGWDALKDAA